MMSFIDVKNVCLALFFITWFNTCEVGTTWHQPNTPANFKVVVAVSCDRSLAETPMAAMQKKLTQNLEASEVFYQSVVSDTEKQELTFNIIGYKDEKDTGNFGSVLSAQVDLQLTTAIRVTDFGVKALMDTILLKENLSGIFDINLVPGADYGAFGGLAVLGGCNKDGLEMVKSAFQKYEETLPFDIHWGENKFMAEGEQTGPAFLMYGSKKNEKNIITQNHVVGATAAPSPYSGEIEINFVMDGKGATLFGEMTSQAAYDNNREILIILNEMVASAPRVNDPILGGRASISGNYEKQEAMRIASLLDRGGLPCDVKIVKEGKIKN